MLSSYIAIGIGGGLGSMSRVALSKLLPTVIAGVPFPIMAINILGCFIIGLLSELMGLHWQVPNNIKYLLIPGFLGGFTTFSSFALEFGALCEENKFGTAFTYAMLSTILGLCLFFAGTKLIKVCAPMPRELQLNHKL